MYTHCPRVALIRSSTVVLDAFTGDGCGASAPLIGYRYKCSKCPNHDICEQCFDAWAGGTGVITNKLSEQKLSSDPKEHNFKVHKDKNYKVKYPWMFSISVAFGHIFSYLFPHW